MAKSKSVRDPEAAKERLARLSEGLGRALDDPDGGYVWLSQDEAAYLQKCLQSFLSGREKTLDAAFQVKRPRGAPKTQRPNDKTLQQARMAMFRDGRSWKDIADELRIDQRSVQRTAQRHQKAVLKEMAADLVKRLKAIEPPSGS